MEACADVPRRPVREGSLASYGWSPMRGRRPARAGHAARARRRVRAAGVGASLARATDPTGCGGRPGVCAPRCAPVRSRTGLAVSPRRRDPWLA